MYRLIICTFLIFLLPVVAAQSQSSASIDAYIASQSPIAKANLLANIGSTGSKSQGAKPGVVIASPSSKDPNYLYTWTRDSSLVFKLLIDQFVYIFLKVEAFFSIDVRGRSGTHWVWTNLHR